MQWWNDFLEWIASEDGSTVMTTAIVPFVAIIIAGWIGASIGRRTARRVIAHQDREIKAAAVTALIQVGRKAASWSTLVAEERQRVEFQSHEAEVRVRLLPMTGASLAADWAVHQLADMKRNSVSFSFQAEQTLLEYRDRLIEWQYKPARAKKAFALDLERWRFEDTSTDKELVEKQQNWAQEQLAVDKPKKGKVAEPASSQTFAPQPQPQPTPVAPTPAPEPIAAAPAAAQRESSPADPDHGAGFVDDDSAEGSQSPTETASEQRNDHAPRSNSVMRPTVPIASLSDDSDLDTEDTADRSPFSPPVTAQKVRERILPDHQDPTP